MSDLISRAAAIEAIESHLRVGDEVYPLTRMDKILNHAFEIAASCVYNLPTAEVTLCHLDGPCEYQNADIAMTSAQPEQKWIPVSERLPEEGWCLCTVHGVFYDYCEILSCRKRKRKMRFFRLDDDCEYVDFTNWVTAWMPLPMPWRGEDDERLDATEQG